MLALPSPSCPESVVLLGKQAWLLLFLASLCLSLPFFLLPLSHCLSQPLFELCESFIAAVLPAQSLRILKWHLKPFEIQPGPLPPLLYPQSEMEQNGGPDLAVSLGGLWSLILGFRRS